MWSKSIGIVRLTSDLYDCVVSRILNFEHPENAYYVKFVLCIYVIEVVIFYGEGVVILEKIIYYIF